MDGTSNQAEGTTRLIEVFSVIYFGHDEITPDKQIGTIKVDDHLRVNYLYNVDKIDMSRPSIHHGDEIMLTGPNVAPILGGITVFDLDLFGGTYKDCIHFDCRPNLIESQPYTRIVTSQDGKGEIHVLYSLFKNATSAHVEVKLTKNNFTAEVYGVVAASISVIERPEFTSILFLNKPEHRIKLGPGDRISLSRSIVAVPLGSRLFLDVHLCDDKDDEIVKGSVEFIAQFETAHSEIRHSSPKTIGDKKGEVEVNVNWKAALTSAEEVVRAENNLEYVLKFLCETMNQQNVSLSMDEIDEL